ncbi:dTDP-glucose 4,6-dehydratase [Fodinicola feengrottensis]|uniref:dTDP-glucose 4,6-dehydratase n=1 Tax=Fodinicola feengrottensis TaxID=435914 RepID=A0ABN2HJY2_9ACTN
MRLVVTGGAGFIGSEFVRAALTGQLEFGSTAGDLDLVVLDALTYSGNRANLANVADDPRLHFVTGDICDPVVVAQVMYGADAVVHFAAESHVDRSIADPAAFVRTNAVGTQTLLESARRAGVGRFVHVSTDEVYGSIGTGSWTPDQPLAPNSPYAASKAAGDLMALAYFRTYGMDVVVTRGSNTYGPFQFPEKIIPLFVTNLMDGGTVPLYGDGANVRDWLHVTDHCQGVAAALRHGRAGGVYHLGGGTELSNRELTGRLLELCGAGWDSVRHVEDRKGHDLRYSLDIAASRAELGYQPSVDIDAGLAATVDWYRTHRAWWEPLRATAS